ncbi:MAG TPA: hypothetical protein VK061_08830 [Bacillota bacterium]|nr:hypothetical protein [Bacillota bacterium]
MVKEKQHPKLDQADELKQLFEEIEEGQSNNQLRSTQNEPPTIDVLDLPPRKEIHDQKQIFPRINLNKAFIRFVFVIILICFIVYFLLSVENFNLFEIFRNPFTILNINIKVFPSSIFKHLFNH